MLGGRQAEKAHAQQFGLGALCMQVDDLSDAFSKLSSNEQTRFAEGMPEDDTPFFARVHGIAREARIQHVSSDPNVENISIDVRAHPASTL